MRLHGSSLLPSDNAANIISILSSKKAKQIMVSLRYHGWRRKLFRAALATASLVALYWTSCCNNSKSCGGVESADGQTNHAFQLTLITKTLNCQSPESSQSIRRNWDWYKYIFKQ